MMARDRLIILGLALIAAACADGTGARGTEVFEDPDDEDNPYVFSGERYFGSAAFWIDPRFVLEEPVSVSDDGSVGAPIEGFDPAEVIAVLQSGFGPLIPAIHESLLGTQRAAPLLGEVKGCCSVPPPPISPEIRFDEPPVTK